MKLMMAKKITNVLQKFFANIDPVSLESRLKKLAGSDDTRSFPEYGLVEIGAMIFRRRIRLRNEHFPIL